MQFLDSKTYGLLNQKWTPTLFSAIFFAWMVLVQGANADDQSDREKFFESKVRPLIVQKCLKCHGPEEQSGDVRFDRPPSSSSIQFIVAGNPDRSRLIKAVRYTDLSLQMPPDGKLAEEEIRTLTDWIQSGAYWPIGGPGTGAPGTEESISKTKPPAEQIDEMRLNHWSYRPIESVVPTTVSDSKWSQHPIDRFIFAKLDQAGLQPSSAADKRTLIQRAYFNLIGLPPTYDEVEAFDADPSPEAFPRLVDRLLDSRHYGERWARHWLDIARFAETTGYFPGSADTSYPYAYTYRDYVINAFNDDKPFDRFIVEQIAADLLDLKEDEKPALAALGFLTVGRRFMNRVQDIIDDRIDVVTRGFLGTTVTCARCHDHKFDPIPTADYYSLYGVFASTSEPEELPLLGDPKSNPKYEEFLAEQSAKESEVAAWLERKRQETEHELRNRVADYLAYAARSLPNSGHADVKPLGERGALRGQVASNWKKYLADSSDTKHPVWTLWHQLASLPADQFESTANDLLGETSTANWLKEVNPLLVTSLRADPPKSMEAAAKNIGKQLEAAYARWMEALTSDPAATKLVDDEMETLRATLFASDSPTVLDTEKMRRYLDQAEQNKYNQELSKVKAVQAKHSGAPGRAMILVDRDKPYDPHIFLRGQPGNPGRAVPRRFLQVFSHVDGGHPFTKGSGRLELAQAIANPKNPLTPRVLVNRVWQYHFGNGLVRTASDFGTRGEKPSHPELLDFLAAEFVADGWSIKNLQRRIVLSATWQQSSQFREEPFRADPENRLLWSMPRRRLEFEPLRDRWLSASGKLDLQIGGRSAKIHEEAPRRGLYAYMDRDDVPSLLASFDVPSPDASQSVRTKTTVPQQALYMINSKFLIEQADALARLTMDPISDSERIVNIYRRALARDPVPEEIQLGLHFLKQESETESIDPWVQLAQVLLASNEFAFVD